MITATLGAYANDAAWVDWGDFAYYTPPLGAARTVVIIVAVIAFAVWLYAHEIRRSTSAQTALGRAALLTLRVGAIALLAWMLAGPMREAGLTHRVTPRSALSLLVDTSRSMNERDVPGAGLASEPRTRWQAARPWLDPALFADRAGGAPVSIGFDDQPRPRSLSELRRAEPDGRSTHLFEAIDEATSRPIADGQRGVLVVISDGHDTQRFDAPGLAERVRQRGWRIIAAPVGTSRPRPDVSLSAWAGASTVIRGQTLTIHAELDQSGFDGAPVRVDLMQDGAVIDSREVTLAGRSAVRFAVQPKASPDEPVTLRSYELVARPIAGEAETANNRRWVHVQVTRDRIRVAMYEGRPAWDTRFLARTLRDDPQVELSAAYAIGDRRQITVEERPGNEPLLNDDGRANVKALEDMDVVVLGRGCEVFFDGGRATELASFVRERGGVLVMARGQPFDVTTPAGESAADAMMGVDPVAWGERVTQQMGLAVTEAGERSPLLAFEKLGKARHVITRLPDMRAVTRVVQRSSASIVLLEQAPRARQPVDGGSGTDGAASEGTTRQAAVVHQQVGAGRVFAVLSEGMWRWAFLPARNAELDSVYHVFWSRAIRWLALGGEFLPGQAYAMELDRLTAEPGDTVGVTVTGRFESDRESGAPRLTLTGHDGGSTPIALTRASQQSPRWAATVTVESPGVHTLRLDPPVDAGGVAAVSPDAEPLVRRPIAVYDTGADQVDPSPRHEALESLARETGGVVLPYDEPERLLDWLSASETARAPQAVHEPAFHSVTALLLVFLLLGIEWFVRRQTGLA